MIEISPGCDEDWSSFLTHELGRSVRVRFGRARRQVIVARPRGATLEVRLNEHFSEAPPDVRKSVAVWLRSGRRAPRACERLDRWIAELERRLGPPPRRRVQLETRGEHHDLEPLLTDLLQREFAEGPLAAGPRPEITWGRRGTRRAKRSLQLGSYDPETRLVRVHPVLDQAGVPSFFVRYVLFHELLHALLDRAEEDDGATATGRRRHHGPRFRAAESAYVDYERALHWQEKNVAALVRAVRTGKPLRAEKPRRWRDLAQAWLFPELGA